jgi:hypothetical protein
MQDFINNLEIALEKKRGSITAKDVYRNYPDGFLNVLAVMFKYGL